MKVWGIIQLSSFTARFLKAMAVRRAVKSSTVISFLSPLEKCICLCLLFAAVRVISVHSALCFCLEVIRCSCVSSRVCVRNVSFSVWISFVYAACGSACEVKSACVCETVLMTDVCNSAHM